MQRRGGSFRSGLNRSTWHDMKQPLNLNAGTYPGGIRLGWLLEKSLTE